MVSISDGRQSQIGMYLLRDCRRKFTMENGIHALKHPPSMLSATPPYKFGVSLDHFIDAAISAVFQVSNTQVSRPSIDNQATTYTSYF
jgi:hypothetical protein